MKMMLNRNTYIKKVNIKYKKISFFYFLIILSSFNSLTFSQTKNEDDFKPYGDIILRGFFDYSTDFGSADNESGFDITRALLGYKYQITPTLSGQIVIDGAAGRNEDNELEVYLRNAFIRWQDMGFDISVGEIGLLQFKQQENYWKHRYVLKSFQDLKKMGASVDLGVTAEYTFNPFISADISVSNGEGYKDVSKNNSTKYATGVSVRPIKNALFRVYADIYNQTEELRGKLPEGVTDAQYKNQYTLSLFTGYQNKLLSAGVEFSKLFNKGFIENKDMFGYSFFTSVQVAPKWNVFGRYDLMDSSSPSNFTKDWNDLDGQLAIAGIEFVPIKQLKIAPNFRNINPDRRKSEQYLFINVDFNW